VPTFGTGAIPPPRLGGRFVRNQLLCLLASLTLLFCTWPASATTITLSGLITQSTSDGTGPAVNNPMLNNIMDGDMYSLLLIFTGAIPGPGTYHPTGATFTDLTNPAAETSFGTMTLTISASGSFDNLSLLACLTTGSSCAVGNFLGGNFQILATSLNSQNVAATGLDLPHPMDLQEDDGTTDIHGSITRYSFSGPVSTVPEPSSLVLVALGLATLWAKKIN
jgi:hypothetical protein